MALTGRKPTQSAFWRALRGSADAAASVKIRSSTISNCAFRPVDCEQPESSIEDASTNHPCSGVLVPERFLHRANIALTKQTRYGIVESSQDNAAKTSWL